MKKLTTTEAREICNWMRTKELSEIKNTVENFLTECAGDITTSLEFGTYPVIIFGWQILTTCDPNKYAFEGFENYRKRVLAARALTSAEGYEG